MIEKNHIKVLKLTLIRIIMKKVGLTSYFCLIRIFIIKNCM